MTNAPRTNGALGYKIDLLFSNSVSGTSSPETMTEKNATYYIDECNRNGWTTAPVAPWFLKSYEVFSATSEMEVLERVMTLLDKTGIPYVYDNFMILVGTAHMSCTIRIYRNTGEYAKTRSPYSLTNSPIVSDMDTFIVEQDDMTRYFSELIRYIIENYSAEVVESFSYKDLDFGCYCQEPELYGDKPDAASAFQDECAELND
jgi:hypothetical protein